MRACVLRLVMHVRACLFVNVCEWLCVWLCVVYLRICLCWCLCVCVCAGLLMCCLFVCARGGLCVYLDVYLCV